MKQAILLPAVVTTMKLLVMKVLKCLLVMEYVDIGLLIPANIPFIIMEVIIVMMLVEVDIGHKRPATLPLAIVEQELIMKGEADIGIILATLPPITQVTMIYC